MRGPLLERMPPFEGSRLRATENLVSEGVVSNGIVDQSPEETPIIPKPTESSSVSTDIRIIIIKISILHFFCESECIVGSPWRSGYSCTSVQSI